MIEPKAFNRPRLYYQRAYGDSDRVRIIYPNGTATWMTMYGGSTYFGEFDSTPCWLQRKTMASLPRSGNGALRLMREFDERQSFPEAEFLGEL